MNIAFLFIAEPYQCYHGAAIALELARSRAQVTIWYNDPGTPAELERIRAAFGAPALDVRRLRRSWLTRKLQRLRFLGLCKPFVLWDNRRVLNRADAIVTVEDTVWLARWLGVRPKLIYSPHGAGDRAVGFVHRVRAFGLVLLAGEKTAARMLAGGLIQPGGYAVTGSVKMETQARLRAAVSASPAMPEACARPVVLYNPHKAPGLTSWERFIEPMLEAFAAQDAFALIVAPHVKMFHRRSARVRQAWERRSTAHTLVDTGSESCMDGTYTDRAQIYVGDVSSQVYEFLAEPRPCVFLNARRRAWRDDPDFAHWHLGDVVDDPADLMGAVRVARARHERYRMLQEQAARASLGEPQGSAARAAGAIMAFLSA